MSEPIKRMAFGCIVTVIVLLTGLSPGLPWSVQFRHALKRIAVRMEMRVAAWQGEQPKLVSLSGRVILERPRNEALKGAQIEALDSTSGWASLTDEHGEFTLRDVIWYPNTSYTLIMAANDYQARQIRFSAPAAYPDGGLIRLGVLKFDQGCAIETDGLPGKNSISYVTYDKENSGFYRQVFAQLTQGKQSDEEKVEVITRYVATRLNVDETTDSDESPRRLLERGTAYCGKLALALATLAESAGYRTRLIDLIDDATHSSAHMLTEVYYGDRWHVYDPTAGALFRDKQNRVASYKDLRLDPALASSGLPAHLPAIIAAPGTAINGIFRSGFHHYYYLRATR